MNHNTASVVGTGIHRPDSLQPVPHLRSLTVPVLGENVVQILSEEPRPSTLKVNTIGD